MTSSLRPPRWALLLHSPCTADSHQVHYFISSEHLGGLQRAVLTLSTPRPFIKRQSHYRLSLCLVRHLHVLFCSFSWRVSPKSIWRTVTLKLRWHIIWALLILSLWLFKIFYLCLVSLYLYSFTIQISRHKLRIAAAFADMFLTFSTVRQSS